MYKTEKSFDVIKGIVPDFRNYINNDINLLAVKINGASSTIVPQKGNFTNIQVDCDKETNGEWDTDRWGLFMSKIQLSPTSCSVEFTIQEGDNWTFSYTGEEQFFIVPIKGKYKIELWGAQGGTGRLDYPKSSSPKPGGIGGYTVGEIDLDVGKNFYIYVGGKGGNSAVVEEHTGGAAGYNGGGTGGNDTSSDACPDTGGGGGGATDIRLVNGDCNDFNSLKSRIMVAGGGAGGAYHGNGGVGGSNSIDTNVYQFGLGANGITAADGGGAGGGGYYGGAGGSGGYPGYGGSSYISGHEGCKTIEQNATSDHVTFSDQSIHYSSIFFTNTQMIDGSGFTWTSEKQTQVTLPTSGDTTGNGYAKITYLGS